MSFAEYISPLTWDEIDVDAGEFVIGGAKLDWETCASDLSTELSPTSLPASTESISENHLTPDWPFSPPIPVAPSDQMAHKRNQQAPAPQSELPSAKSRRRKEQNRSSQRAYRDRQKKVVFDLMNEVDRLKTNITMLEQQLAGLQGEVLLHFERDHGLENWCREPN